MTVNFIPTDSGKVGPSKATMSENHRLGFIECSSEVLKSSLTLPIAGFSGIQLLESLIPKDHEKLKEDTEVGEIYYGRNISLKLKVNTSCSDYKKYIKLCTILYYQYIIHYPKEKALQTSSQVHDIGYFTFQLRQKIFLELPVKKLVPLAKVLFK